MSLSKIFKGLSSMTKIIPFSSKRKMSIASSIDKYFKYSVDDLDASTPLIYAPTIFENKQFLTFYDMNVTAYFYQIVFDLERHFKLSYDDAFDLAAKWKFVHPGNEDVKASGVIYERSPYFYATQLFYEFVKTEEFDEWKLKTEKPANYEYCQEFQLFVASIYSANRAKCESMWNDSKTLIDNKAGTVYIYGTIERFVNYLLKETVDLNKSSKDLDFNSTKSTIPRKAFYVTNDWVQACQWAKRDASVRQCVVVDFVLDRYQAINNAKWKNFDSYNEWVQFVIASRNGNNDHDFDFVEGPYFHNPEYKDQIEATINGIAKPEDQVYAVPNGHQVAVCTEHALSFIKYQGYTIV